MIRTSNLKNRSAGHKLSGIDRKRWTEDGYLLVKRALSRDQRMRLLRSAKRLIARTGRSGRLLDHVEMGSKVRVRTLEDLDRPAKVIRAIERSPAIDVLTDLPATFGPLVELMGPYLQILGTEVFARPNVGTAGVLGWHTDGGPALRQVLADPASHTLQLKVQFFLTDVSRPDHGNFMLVPGSHRRHFAESDAEPAGAIQLLAEAGDALIFPWSLWHAVAPNQSGGHRISATLRYGQLWCRPYDYVRLPKKVMTRLSPRRRRLFGDLGPQAGPNDFYQTDEEEQLELIYGALHEGGVNRS